MTDARYVYCISEGGASRSVGKIGLFDSDVFILRYKDIVAYVSEVPYRAIQSDLQNILAHQRVVEASRKIATTLPVKFGVIFKTEEGVQKLLSASYEDYTSKISKLRSKDEFGVKVLVSNPGMERIRHSLEEDSEIRRLKEELSIGGAGTSYFTKMKLDEAIRSELYKRIDRMSQHVHQQLVELADDSSLLKSDHAQIVLNAAYLINRRLADEFVAKVDALKKQYSGDGLTIHLSGPWAPYTFC